jgi:type II secretory pathway pseudopilin PulG
VISHCTCFDAQKNNIINVEIIFISRILGLLFRKGKNMRRFSKSILGVTLLEVMLVLAIAAMIIVMSVRYYQSASSSQQANSVIEQLQSITAAADGLAQASGSYDAASISTATLTPLLPNGTYAFTTPWGTDITIGTPSASSYSVSIADAPSGVCPYIVSKLSTNNHYSGISSNTCGTTGPTTISYTYVANP